MGVAEAQAYYDDTGGAGSGFVSAQDAKDAIGVIYTDMDAAIPTGVVWAYAGATAPAGWHLCDGTAHGSSALQTLLGSANAPDLRDRFVLGAGTGHPLGSAPGGEETHTLTEPEIPSHSHAGSAASSTHSHSGTVDVAGSHSHFIQSVPDHTHGLVALNDNTADGGQRRVTGGTGTITDASAPSGAHSHSMDAAGSHNHSFNTGNTGSHTHTITVGSTGGDGAHNNMPPYYVLTYIIKL